MKIFVESHHESLYRSLQLLFEKRLGHKLFRPIGKEWVTEGYWKNAEIYKNHPDTIEQYLGMRNTKPTKMGHRNQVIGEKADHYIVDAPIPEKAVTFEQFMAMDIDVVIASYYANIEPFKRLTNRHPKGPKFVVQMGNTWPIDWNVIDNLMLSAAPVPVPSGKNVVFYHQEFDPKAYRYEPPQHSQYLRSFVHCMMEHEMHKQDWADMLKLEKQAKEYKIESYGISCRDGKVMDQHKLGDMMRESHFGIHFKNHGDGYGHVAHNWFSVGRPVIFKGSQYKDKLAGLLMIDGETGFDYEKGHVIQKIRDLSWERYQEMCLSARNRFTNVVDFNREEEMIKRFMENLI